LLANLLLNVNLQKSVRPSQPPLRSVAKVSPLVGLSAIANLITPARAAAEESTSSVLSDDLLKTAFNQASLKAFKYAVDIGVGSLENIKYLVEHAGDLTIVGVFLFFASKFLSNLAGPRPGRAPPGGPPSLLKAFGVQPSTDPKEYLKIERLNEKLESFDYSLQKAVVSKKAASRQQQKLSFNRRFGAELASFNLDTKVLEDIAALEQNYRESDAYLRASLSELLSEMRTNAMEGGNSSGMMAGFMKARLKKNVADFQAERFQLETEFLSALSKLLSPEQASRISEILKLDDQPFSGTVEAVTSLENMAASALAESKHVWVLKFNGDAFASQVGDLRQEITALLRVANSSRGDEALLVLNSGGGTVTGYGLAAAQLMRIKKAGIPLTISVEQVAASGGYMMACIADKLFASPFAVLGSVGVVTEQPNVYERLKKEGVTFSTLTAGKYKRSLTPTKKIEEEDIEKEKEDLERVLVLFRDFVGKRRPNLDMDKIATGEIWFGPDALDQGLVDGLSTVDEILLDLVSHGAEVYSIEYEEKTPLGTLLKQGVQGRNVFSSPSSWGELALSLLGGLVGSRSNAASDSSFYSGAFQEDIATRGNYYENQFMLKRPLGKTDPMVQWKGEKSAADSWHGL